MEYLEGSVLGIETSCDETSVAIIDGRKILSNIVCSQADLHQKWGGIVPESASRKHVENFLPTLEEALTVSGVRLDELSGIGVTNRPGLIGALSVGVSAARSLALCLDCPLLGVDHLEGHLLSPFLVEDVRFPHVCLLVSGGHTALYIVEGVGEYRKIGGTLDDAAGEAFDKTARVLGLGYPGGPAIERAGMEGDSRRYVLSGGLVGDTYDFSFSGLKTAMLYLARDEGERLDVASAAASFEETITSVLARRSLRALEAFDCELLTVVGGVAANRRLRHKLEEGLEHLGRKLVAVPQVLCTDNAAMIAHVASIRLARGERSGIEMDTFATSELSGG